MSDTPRSLANCRILVVEDEYMIASEVGWWLGQAGAEVEGPWPSVKEALAHLEGKAARIDAGVLDINLGRGETVYPVADRLDRLGIPYVFTTGNNLGADDPAYKDRPRLEKPVSSRALLRAVGKLLEGRREAGATAPPA